MAGPGSGRRARGDCCGEGPAPLIQQPARTSGSAAAAALAQKETLSPGLGPTASSRSPGRSSRHINNKPPARSSGPSPREASREARVRPRPRPRVLWRALLPVQPACSCACAACATYHRARALTLAAALLWLAPALGGVVQAQFLQD